MSVQYDGDERVVLHDNIALESISRLNWVEKLYIKVSVLLYL